MTEHKYRVVIKSLREPDGRCEAPRVVVDSGLSLTSAASLLKRFPKLRWTERRPGVLTLDHISLVVERDPGPKEER